MTIVIYKHDYSNFEGEKTYLVFPFDLMTNFDHQNEKKN
jgi:hypothetical protein